MPKKPKPRKPALEVPLKGEDLIQKIADAADREGMLAKDLIRFPELLKRQRIVQHVSHTMAQEADELNRRKVASIQERVRQHNARVTQEIDRRKKLAKATKANRNETIQEPEPVVGSGVVDSGEGTERYLRTKKDGKTVERKRASRKKGIRGAGTKKRAGKGGKSLPRPKKKGRPAKRVLQRPVGRRKAP